MEPSLAVVLDKILSDAGIPVVGVDASKEVPKARWFVTFDQSATDQQKADAQAVLDAFDIAAYEASEQADKDKTTAYETDTDRKTFWDNVDTMTKDEFVSFVDGFITNQDTAKTAIVRLALEVGRLRRKVG